MGVDLWVSYSAVMLQRKDRGGRLMQRGEEASHWGWSSWRRCHFSSYSSKCNPVLILFFINEQILSWLAWIQICVPDICSCWKLLHISPAFPRVPLRLNTPAVRTKWTRASEMSNLLKGEMSRHEHNLCVGPRSERASYTATAVWLMREKRHTSRFSLSKHIWILWMTYRGRNNTNPEGCERAQLGDGCLKDRHHPNSYCRSWELLASMLSPLQQREANADFK